MTPDPFPRENPTATPAQSLNFNPAVNRTFRLPRLEPQFYRGTAVIHWSMSIAGRKTGWLTDHFHAHFRETMLHTAARQNLLCPAYCLMPDHIHLMWMGTTPASDQKQGMKFLREHLGEKLKPFAFQHQAYDHVLRDNERKRQAFAMICFYILDNPRRATLFERAPEWRFSGAIVPGFPTLNPTEDGFWRIFWEVYATALNPK